MSNIYGGDEVNALVLDTGGSTTKAGYAGDDAPKAMFPSHVGITQATKESSGMEVDGAAPARKLHVGQSAVNFRRDNMEIVSPYNGIEDAFSDWELVEALWDHALRDRLRADPSDYAMMMAEPNLLTKQSREKMVELLFEKFKVPALFLAKNAALSCFASARQTALVVDAGYRSTAVTVVQDGYVLNKSAAIHPVGGKVLSLLMQRALENRATKLLPRYAFTRTQVANGEFKVEEHTYPNTHPSYHSYQVEQLVSDIKESLCRVHETPFDEVIHAHLPIATYELPDGTQISVGTDRLKVPEVYFQPDLLNTFQGFNPESLRRGDSTVIQSLPAAILECIGKCDVDARKDLYQGIVLTGGVAQTPGLKERLEKSLIEDGPMAGRFKVLMPQNTMERKFSVWIGGSILASLGSFQQMWMSRKEFEEHGAVLIHRKAP